MVKRIPRISFVVLFGVGAATLYCADFARASSTYKLQYPQGYGCCCIPNTGEFGYFRTQWREWPGEIRQDKTFPRSIGMEPIPVPEGQEIIPPPKAVVAPKAPGEAQPGTGPQEGTEKPSEGMPGEQPTEPGKETPTLPQLPTEPGGINPTPGLPPDLGLPAPLIPKGKEDNTPATEPKPESEPKTDSAEKGKTDNSAPGPKPEDKGTRIKSLINSFKLSRLDPDRQSSDVARGAAYHEPVESPAAARLSRNIVSQSYQEPSESNEASAVARSELEIDASTNESRRDMPPLAVEGFCPVELSLHGRWVQGDPRWTVVHKGFIFRLSGNAQRQEFLANPEKYIPANGGFDPVISVIEKRNVPGQVNFCAAYKGRIYMFSSAATQNSFHNNPEPYISGSTK
jgi:YHS domain-containing protein